MVKYMALQRTPENNLAVIYRLDEDGNIIYDEREIMILMTEKRAKVRFDSESNLRVTRYEVLERRECTEDYKRLKEIVDNKLGKVGGLEREAA